MKIVAIFFLVYFFTFLGLSEKNDNNCQSFETKLQEARSFFKTFKEIELNLTMRSSFIKNYNKSMDWLKKQISLIKAYIGCRIEIEKELH